MKYIFSKENQELCDLAFDLATLNYSVDAQEGITRADLENTLRQRLTEDVLDGHRTLWQAWRNHKNTVFEIFEEVVNLGIGEGVLDSPFIDMFVEVKNRHLGDETAFYSEGGLLSVAKFAGNHWDTDRESIDVGSEITLPKEWLYIHVYDEIERFLKGIVSLDKLMNKVYQSFNKHIKDRIYAMFQNVANAVPAEFKVSGNDEEAVGGLVDLVQAAGGYDQIVIAGTRGALRKLAGVIPDKMFADSQKEAKAKTGTIKDWEGNLLMPIPQTLKSGTFETALDDTQLFIMGYSEDCKPIKLEFIGDTRTKEDTSVTDNNDQTIALQIQTKIGLGLVVPQYFGLFTFAN